jgi:chemotaxis protein CheZ
MAQCCGADPARQLPAAQVLAFSASVEAASARIDQQLTAIMLAQDFHDMTGQVVAKVVKLDGDIEDQLLQLLVRTAPPAHHHPAADGQIQPSLDGPVVDHEGRSDVVANQSEVDDLLASLGF